MSQGLFYKSLSQDVQTHLEQVLRMYGNIYRGNRAQVKATQVYIAMIVILALILGACVLLATVFLILAIQKRIRS